jgi:hypothetical protein
LFNKAPELRDEIQSCLASIITNGNEDSSIRCAAYHSFLLMDPPNTNEYREFSLTHRESLMCGTAHIEEFVPMGYIDMYYMRTL